MIEIIENMALVYHDLRFSIILSNLANHMKPRVAFLTNHI